MNGETRELIIIGGGPAGLHRRALQRPRQPRAARDRGLPVGRPAHDHERRRELPRLPDGILGPELMQRASARQAERFGAEFVTDDVTRVDFSERPFRVYVGDDEYRAETVIVATGANARQLGLDVGARAPGPRRLVLRGLRRRLLPRQGGHRRRRRRLGDGGGDVPHEVRVEGDARPPPRRVPRLADHARPRPRQREDRVRARTRSSRRCSATRTGRCAASCSATRETGETRELAGDGLFVAIGHDPTTALFLDQLDHDEDGLPRHAAGLDRDERRGRLRRRRRRRPHLPPGGHGRRHRAAWPRSTPSAGSRRARATPAPRSRPREV